MRILVGLGVVGLMTTLAGAQVPVRDPHRLGM